MRSVIKTIDEVKIFPQNAWPNIQGLLMLVLLLFIANKAGRFVEAVLSLYIFYKIIFNASLDRKNIYKMSIVLLIMLTTALATAISSINEVVFSLWQILRSDGWVFISLLVLVLGKNYFRKQNLADLDSAFQYIRIIIIIAFLLTVLELITNLDVAPAAIRGVVDGGIPRIYLVGSIIIFPMLLLALYRKDWMLIVVIFGMVLATQGKVMIVLALVTTLSYAIANKNIKIIVLFITLAFGGWLIIGDRISDLTTEGDTIRLIQINDALVAFSASYNNMLFGIGHGTQYSEGYAQFGFSDGDNALYENSKYDIENFPTYLLIRFGLIGGFLFLLLLFSGFKDRLVSKIFLISVFLYGIGGALFTGSGGVLFVAGYLYVEEYKSKAIDPYTENK